MMFEPDRTSLDRLGDPPEYVWEYVPTDPGSMSGDERRGVGWTVALALAEAEYLPMVRGVPFFDYAAIGFLHETVDAGFRSAEFPAVGIIVYTDEPPTPSEAPFERALRVLRIPGAGTDIQVVVRRGRRRPQQWPQAVPPAVPNGQLACWATSRNGNVQGWLTAAHAAPGMGGTIVDAATECTDAAMVDFGSAPPGARRAAGSYSQLSLLTKVSMHFHQQVMPASVLDVSGDFLMYKDPRFPVRFSLSVSGIPGNSGAFITEAVSGSPLGIYLGCFLPLASLAAAPALGYAQALYQLETMMDLEVFP